MPFLTSFHAAIYQSISEHKKRSENVSKGLHMLAAFDSRLHLPLSSFLAFSLTFLSSGSPLPLKGRKIALFTLNITFILLETKSTVFRLSHVKCHFTAILLCKGWKTKNLFLAAPMLSCRLITDFRSTLLTVTIFSASSRIPFWSLFHQMGTLLGARRIFLLFDRFFMATIDDIWLIWLVRRFTFGYTDW